MYSTWMAVPPCGSNPSLLAGLSQSATQVQGPNNKQQIDPVLQNGAAQVVSGFLHITYFPSLSLEEVDQY